MVTAPPASLVCWVTAALGERPGQPLTQTPPHDSPSLPPPSSSPAFTIPSAPPHLAPAAAC
ncbi:hypothetical protein E2C01_063296 [Portunus trituberculatus]|uniref:Uncharacterized protein n=1 Tax=Portunus trituberculatus TaxID=210409 RepID=A0A5B7H8T0_PORTR|nr:hypothetical protein [Portunus trituberculatus]